MTKKTHCHCRIALCVIAALDAAISYVAKFFQIKQNDKKLVHERRK